MGCCRTRDKPPSFDDEKPCLSYDERLISGPSFGTSSELPPLEKEIQTRKEDGKAEKNGPKVEIRPQDEISETIDEKAEQKSEGTTVDQSLSDSKASEEQEIPQGGQEQLPAPQKPVAAQLPATALSGFIRECEYADPAFRDLETYILSLEKSDKWKPINQPQEGVTGRKLPKSKFSGEVPVFLFTIDFPEPVPAELILGLLDEPDWRSEWDSRMEQINRIRMDDGDYFLQYQLIKCNPPLNYRDFLVKYCIRKVGSEVRVTQKSTSHREFPELKNVERAKTYFGMYRIHQEDKSTKLDAFMQVNMFFSIKRLQDLMPEYLVRWMGRFRELTLTRYRGFCRNEQP